MAKSPDDRDWSKVSKPAQDAYWEARRAGKDETEALLEALKVAIASNHQTPQRE